MNGILFIVLIAVMWAALLIPQQRKMKRQRALVESVGVGDDVMLSSGIYATITGEDDDDLFATITDGVEIRIARGAIASKVEFEDEDETSTDRVELEDETSTDSVEFEDETSLENDEPEADTGDEPTD